MMAKFKALSQTVTTFINESGRRQRVPAMGGAIPLHSGAIVNAPRAPDAPWDSLPISPAMPVGVPDGVPGDAPDGVPGDAPDAVLEGVHDGVPDDPLSDVPNQPWSGRILCLSDVWTEFHTGLRGKVALRELCMKHGWGWLAKCKQNTSDGVTPKLRAVLREIWFHRDQILLHRGFSLGRYKEAELLGFTEMCKQFEEWKNSGGKGGLSRWRDANLKARDQNPKRKALLELLKARLDTELLDPQIVAYIRLK
jgi:hypothetical protein